MDIKKTIESYEVRARESGLILEDILVRIPVDRSTWTRWKNGSVGPRLKKWLAVEETFEKALKRAEARANG